MDVAEIEQMDRLEHEHWWYRGLRDMIARTLRTPRFQLARGAKILDAGCGTGENLRFLRDLLQPSYIGGFDLSPDAVRLTRLKVGDDADLYISDVRDPRVHAESLDLVLSCDVISLAGIEQSKAGLARLVERLRSGGLLILNVAAFRWLYSAHDVITHTQDRASASQVRAMLSDLRLQIELVTYRVFSLFPAIVAARLPSILHRPPIDQARSDLKPNPAWLNATLASTLYFENWAVAHGLRFPWGSSVYAVGRKA